MTDRPIIFSAPMVRALLAGTKTQTRRVLKDAPHQVSGDGISMFCDRVGPTGWQWTGPGGYPRISFTPPYAPGDRLWVKHSADLFPVYFKPIPFGDGKYAVGTDGNLYARTADDWVKRAPRLSHNGYEEISLRYNGDQRPFRINRLVAEAFYGPAPDGYVCRHLDGNRRNNEPGNLDWGTPAQNSADASAAGSFSGERASKARLSSDDVDAIRQSPEPQAVLADRYGVTQPTISKIKSGKRWGEPGEAPSRNFPAFQPWRSPIYCPRWASRLTLTVTDVRVQRVQEISEDDARAEGVRGNAATAWGCEGLIEDYATIWDSLNAKRLGCAWDANPWVTALTFTVARDNIDAMEAAS